jgi:hypothetical protein
MALSALFEISVNAVTLQNVHHLVPDEEHPIRRMGVEE